VPGTTTTYTIVVSNTGPMAAAAVAVTDNLTGSFSADTWSAAVTGGASVGQASGTGNISTIVNVPVGGTITFTLTATVSSSATGTLTNTAMVSSPGGSTPDATPTNNTATATTPLTPQDDLAVTQQAPSDGMEGQYLSYTINVTNNGPSDATGVLLADAVPAGGTFVPALSSSGYNTATGQFSLGTVAAGATVQVTFTVLAGEGTTSNTASVSSAVTDTNASNNSSTAPSVTVTDPPVLMEGGFSILAVEGTGTGLQTLATFADPGGAEGTSHYSATVNWGDGTPLDSNTIITFSAGTFTVQGHHTYAEESGPEHAGSNPYTITVTVHHDQAPDASATSAASVTDPSVVVVGGYKLGAVEGKDTGTVTVARFSDPGGNEPVGDYSASIDWGDGTPQDSNAVISFSNGMYTVKGHHVYEESPASAPYTILVIVHHEGAFDSPAAQSTASVSDPAVVASSGFNFTVPRGSSFGPQTVAVFTDPAGPEVVGDYSATINWGDGTPADNSGVIVQSGNTFSVLGSHTYAQASGANPYTIQVVVHHEQAPDSAPVTSKATVTDQQISVTGATTTIKVAEGGDSGLQTVATFADPSGPGESNYTATVNWGDGTTTTATLANGGIVRLGAPKGIATFAVRAHHAFVTSGSLTPKVTVQHGKLPAVVIFDTAVVSADAVIAGTKGNDVLVLSSTGTAGTVSYTLDGSKAVKLSNVRSFTFNGLAGNDSLSVDLSHGVPMLAGNIVFNGAAGSNTLTINAAGRATRSQTGHIGIVGAGLAEQVILYTGVTSLNLNNAGSVNALGGADTADRTSAFKGLTADERFVQALYLDAIGKPGTKAQLDGWVKAMHAPGGSQSSVALAIEQSRDAREHLVRSWYVSYMGRPAINNEELSWVNLLMTGVSEEQALSQFLSDPARQEFYDRAQGLFSTGTADQRYVQALVVVLLDRQATSAEVSNFTSQLGKVGRQGVALAILTQSGFRQHQFEGYVDALLHRPAGKTELNNLVFGNLDFLHARVQIESTSEFYKKG
jgi:uncharacterized repeat protein (TIGR01451 family)